MYSTEKLTTILSQYFDNSQIRVDQESCNFYGKDWTTAYKPDPSLIVFPHTTEQVQNIIHLANEHNFALVPSGGRTGYSGGAVASAKEVVVSIEQMHQIKDIDLTDRLLSCQSGCVLQTVQETASDNNLYYPIDIASKGSCQIGGNVSTNAGGNHVIKYGMTRNWVAGMTVVTANGDLLCLDRNLFKDNSGYDLKQLFIGSEGTLGIITDVTLKLTQPPTNPQVLLLGLNDLGKILDAIKIFRSYIDLLAFEFFSHDAVQKVIEHHHLDLPLETAYPFYVLLEYDNVTNFAEQNALNAFDACLKDGIVNDGTASQSEEQRHQLWHYREYISESIVQYHPFKCDLSVKPSDIPKFIHEIQIMLDQKYADYKAIWFGHISDGNIHLNLLKPENMSPQQHHNSFEKIGYSIYEVLKKYRGSISAEHGIGLLKKPYLHYTLSELEIQYMKNIKKMWDSKNILNPTKIFNL
jgi:FAD/FMN-containing dehydrogenase